ANRLSGSQRYGRTSRLRDGCKRPQGHSGPEGRRKGAQAEESRVADALRLEEPRSAGVMRLRARSPRALPIASLAVAAALFAPAAFAQAWLPEKGSVGVSLDYTYTLNKKHYDFNGDEGDFGHTRVNVLAAGVSWSPANRVMLQFGLPLVQTQYDGSFPHPGDIDAGGKP